MDDRPLIDAIMKPNKYHMHDLVWIQPGWGYYDQLREATVVGFKYEYQHWSYELLHDGTRSGFSAWSWKHEDNIIGLLDDLIHPYDRKEEGRPDDVARWGRLMDGCAVWPGHLCFHPDERAMQSIRGFRSDYAKVDASDVWVTACDGVAYRTREMLWYRRRPDNRCPKCEES